MFDDLVNFKDMSNIFTRHPEAVSRLNYFNIIETKSQQSVETMLLRELVVYHGTSVHDICRHTSYLTCEQFHKQVGQLMRLGKTSQTGQLWPSFATSLFQGTLHTLFQLA